MRVAMFSAKNYVRTLLDELKRIGTTNATSAGAKVRVGIAIAHCPQVSSAGVGWWFAWAERRPPLRRERADGMF